jgi:phage-related protein
MGRIVEEGLEDLPQACTTGRGSGSLCGAVWRRISSVKALKGFGGRSVLEIVASHEGDTWRVVYTVHFADAVYVLHAFQKKSKRGIATPQKELELIKQRLAAAEQHYRERQN